MTLKYMILIFLAINTLGLLFLEVNTRAIRDDVKSHFDPLGD